MENNKVIASWGLTNTSSFNVFNVSCDYVVGGFNAITLDDCETYEIKYAEFDEDDEIIYDGGDNVRSYIEPNEGYYLFLDECIRIDLGLM